MLRWLFGLLRQTPLVGLHPLGRRAAMHVGRPLGRARGNATPDSATSLLVSMRRQVAVSVSKLVIRGAGCLCTSAVEIK